MPSYWLLVWLCSGISLITLEVSHDTVKPLFKAFWESVCSLFGFPFCYDWLSFSIATISKIFMHSLLEQITCLHTTEMCFSWKIDENNVHGEKRRNVRRRISRPAALQTATTVAALKCIEVEYWLHQHHKSSTLVPENNATKQTKSFLLSYCMLLILSCFGDAQSTVCRDIFSLNRISRVNIIKSISYSSFSWWSFFWAY